MLRVTLEHNRVSRLVLIPDEQLPALRSAIQEIRDELADRISGRYIFEREAAYTRALIALGALAGGLNALIPKGDEAFGPRAHLWPDEDRLHEEAKPTP